MMPWRSFFVSRLAPALALLAAPSGLAALMVGCDSEPSASAERTLTSTVALGSARRIELDARVPLVVTGERRDDAILRLEGTLTASATDVAQRILDGYALTVERDVAQGVVRIAMPLPERGVLGGTLEVRLPQDIELLVLSRGGTAFVDGPKAAVQIESAGDVGVSNAESDVVVRVGSANVRIDTLLRAGNRIDVAVGTGDVQVDLPPRLDANVDVVSTTGVVSTHPSLPSRPASIPYRQSVGSGSASVVVTTGRGAVYFTRRGSN